MGSPTRKLCRIALLTIIFIFGIQITLSQKHRDRDLVFSEGYHQIKKTDLNGDAVLTESSIKQNNLNSDILNSESPVDIPEIDLQKLNDSDDNIVNDEHWLLRGVKRIRRSLENFYGNSETTRQQQEQQTRDETLAKQHKRKHKKAHQQNEDLVEKSHKTKHTKSRDATKNSHAKQGSITKLMAVNPRSKRQHENGIDDDSEHYPDDTDENEDGEDIDEEEEDENFTEKGSGLYENVVVEDEVGEDKWFRVKFALNEYFVPQYEERNSAEYRNLSLSLSQAIKAAYAENTENLPLDNNIHSSLVSIQKDEFESFNCFVTLDITTEVPVSISGFKRLFKRSLEAYSLGDLKVSIRHFTFRVLEGRSQAEDELKLQWESPSYEDNGEISGDGDIEDLEAINNLHCKDGERKCRDGHKCISEDDVCNQHQDCDDNSDEENCPECEDNEFPCDGSRCIPMDQRCDNAADCTDGTDEMNCPPRNTTTGCKYDEFKCSYNDECIPITRRCDQISDCPDHEDELNCDNCRENQFQCRNGECVPKSKKCDKVNDCPFGDDEAGCDEEVIQIKAKYFCPLGKYTCGDSSCISILGRCDGHVDCPKDTADEDDCPCSRSKWQCDYGQCIPMEQRCNGNIDCPDDVSDERSCPRCVRNQFKCDDGTCIESYEVCDKVFNCPDKSDERACQPKQIACNSEEFQCGNGVCIEWRLRCDGYNHCNDLTDEKDCDLDKCDSEDFTCANGQCIALSQVCNNEVECDDGSDELNCNFCSENQFQCHDGYQCVDKRSLCDGNSDCEDGSDELDCGDHLDKCTANEFMCSEGDCYPIEDQCNGVEDCPDGSDEISCDACRDGAFLCGNNQCIEGDKRCDGVEECSDGSDEIDCPRNNTDYFDPSTSAPPPAACKHDQWECENKECINLDFHCDGSYDCLDKSDERDCPAAPKDCKRHEFFCDGQCHDNRKKCDSIPDCSDGTDEADCDSDICPEASCADGTCISDDKMCNGYRDCRDGSDESHCRACNETEFACADGRTCIEAALRCDSYYDCKDFSDEQNCPACKESQYQCNDGSCIEASQQCDRRPDCSDGGDEEDCPSSSRCYPNEFTCANGECVPLNSRCDRRPDCRDRSDERDCPSVNVPQCQSNEFTCGTGQCIPSYRKCDRRIDCTDGSDEANCHHSSPTRCKKNEWQCGSGECISLRSFCDNRIDCSDYSDEKNCHEEGRDCDRNMFRCENGPCILNSLRCNGYVDCPFDTSDELDCPSSSAPPSESPRLNIKTYPNDQIIKERQIREGREVVFQCRDEGPIRARVQWVRPNNRALPPGSTDISGRLEIPNIRFEHSGEYVCQAVGYPRGTPGSSVTVYLTVEKYDPTIDRPKSACSSTEATCMNGECISKSKICDGYPDCSDGTDENSCSHKHHGCEPNEFRCRNNRCVLKTWRCDGENDCGDMSDEETCAPASPNSPCRYDEFQCRNGQQCVPKSFQCDSQPDCLDKSDEIGCTIPAVIVPPPPMITLESGNTFNISCRATGVPVPLIVWRLNWGHIPEKCRTSSVNGFGVLTCPDIQPIDAGAYSCEIINTMGTIFVSPDTILIVSGNRTVCPSGYFNSEATRTDECINCFCFGVSNQCSSANLFINSLNPPINTYTTVAVEGPWSGSRDIRLDEYDSSDLTATRHGVQYRVSDIPDSRQFPYYSLPHDYLGNQLTSYGGSIKYDVEFVGRGAPNDAPEIIIIGNGYTLTYRHESRILDSTRTSVNAKFVANNWYKLDGTYASREELMMTLANIEKILIKLKYIEGAEREVEILNIVMDTAAVRDFLGLGAASLVEECRCPTGYRGLSCETCDIGYTRQKSGAWLGRCVREEEQCRVGYYRDLQGSCKQCPCPVPGNSFARSCSLGRDGDVTCNCDQGYAGRRCEVCAPGYSGNPLTQRGCYPASQCNSDGTESVASNGRCICKTGVEGTLCDQCSFGSFYLNPSGCIGCFCMGVTQQCSSTTYFRDNVRASFIGPQSAVRIVAGHDDPELLPYSLSLENQEAVYRNFDAGEETYYWSLSPNFLGNKVTSYGGNLTYTVRYTPQPSGSASRSNSPDVVIHSGNKITLHHYRQDGSSLPNGAYTYSVPIVPESWQHYDDGISANREHLLMALADINAIYIKATYTTVAKEAALSYVSLDTASKDNYASRNRAWEVEQCSCPRGHEGLSCEDCSPGYFKSDNGIYLGLCEPCECNGHSEECDAKTGTCLNCRHNTAGESCEYCAAGYSGNATQGSAYDCRKDVGNSQYCDECDRRGYLSCDDRRGSCTCKGNVVGQLCDQCREGTFGLDESKREGCTECFCSGTTSICSSSHLFREQIPLFIEEEHGFYLTNRENTDVIRDGFETAIFINEISYSFNNRDSVYYWNLPSRLLGNQILSYGGNFVATVKAEGHGELVPDKDLILTGNSITLFWSRTDFNDDTITVPFVESSFQRLDRNGPRPASRSDLLTVLSNIDSILVRATLNDYTIKSSISDISLDTAIKQNTYKAVATDVEVCKCPLGYTGTSCEQCDRLYYRNVYDRTAGLLGTCQQCPCENAESCSLGTNRRVVCACKAGYTGEHCTTPLLQPPTESPIIDAPPPTIKVTISSPTLQIVEIGETIKLNCNGYYIVNRLPLNVRWYKLNGRLPENAYVDSGTLVISNSQVDDSGIYVCQAENGPEIVKEQVTVAVGRDDKFQSPDIRISPQHVDVAEYSPVEVVCDATGNPAPEIIWERLDNDMSSDVIIRGGYLRFNSIRVSDAGNYNCYARNSVGEQEQTIDVFVREQNVAPIEETVEISPVRYIGNTGDEIRLTCSCRPYGRTSWTKYGGQLPQNAYISGDILIMEYASVENNGRYICTAQFNTGRNKTSYVDVSVAPSQDIGSQGQGQGQGQGPKISPLPRKNNVIQGDSITLSCSASGYPAATIKWTLNGRPFASNVQQVSGNVLRISNATSDNAGLYVCLAENSFGADQASTIVEVERREPPLLELYPAEPQTIKVGESARFSCRAIAGIPSPTIAWSRRDGRLMGSNIIEDYPGVITFRDVTLENSGEYECRAVNAAGSNSITASLSILQAPEITIKPNIETMQITEGDELVINCKAEGKPIPSVQWHRQGLIQEARGIALGSATIEVYRVSKNDAGIYECTATNDAGSDTKYIQVEVKTKRGDVGISDYDVPDEYPRERPQSRPYKIPLGGQATLSCTDENNFNTRTEWRRTDGRPLPFGANLYNGKLTINNLQHDASGTYECIAYDGSPEPFTIDVAEIIIIEPPRITFSPSMPMQVRNGDNVVIHCMATGEQPIDIRWHAGEDRYLPSSVTVRDNDLHFDHITNSDAGLYYCSASNVHGNAEKVAEVIVSRDSFIPTDPQYGKTHEVRPHDSVTLDCLSSNDAVRGTSFTWERENADIPYTATHRGNHLILNDFDPSDSGRYICHITYPNGQQSKSYVDVISKTAELLPLLKVEPSRSFLRPGESIQVDCSSSAGPYVKVTWQRNNGGALPQNFRQIGNRLEISNVHTDNSGKYSCVCYTDDGQLYVSDYELNIEEAPAKQANRPPKVEHAEIGTSTILRCNSHRYPTTFSWTRQNGVFHSDQNITSDVLHLTDLQASDAGTYICTSRSNGQVIEVPTTLVVTGAIPFFPQSPKSYMTFNKLEQTYAKFNFEVTFKPDRDNGLILYNSQNRGNGDYIALSLNNGYPEFRFDFGGQHAVLRPEKPIKLHEWHTVKVNRVRNNGFMIVDDQHPVVFPSDLKFHGLNLEDNLYLGGVPKYENIVQTATEHKQGFVGCISRLILNEKEVQLYPESIYSEGVTSCEPCGDEPCMNEGVCLETQTENGYTCVCRDGYTGKRCQIEGFQCSNDVCGVGRCAEVETGIECYCPLHRAGDKCQYIEHYDSGVLSFRDTSYAAYDKLTNKKVIKFRIRPESTDDGLILYAAESEKAYGDFLAVIVKDKYIELRYNVGGKHLPTIVRSNQPITPNVWTEVSVGRSRAGLGYLQVGDEPQINEPKTGRPQTMFLKTHLYIGGYDKRMVLNRGVGVSSGFNGCITGLEVAGQSIGMIADVRDSANVQNCGESYTPVVKVPEVHDNGGVCPPGFIGRNCEIITDLCLAQDPCEHGGICRANRTNYVCDCPLGRSGTNCQHLINLDMNAQFKGNSYLEIDYAAFSKSTSQLNSSIALLFSTTEPNGLLIWHGQAKGVNYDGQDFMALAVVDGLLEYSTRLDGEEAIIKYGDYRVDDGKRHIAIIKRSGNQVILEVDYTTTYGENRPTGKKNMDFTGHVFFGGAPDLNNFTGNRYTQGLTGCIHIIESVENGPINLGINSITGMNIDTCKDDDNEIDLGTEPPLA